MKPKENCIEHVTDCSCGHIKAEDMSNKEFHIFLFALRKHMRELKEIERNYSNNKLEIS